MESDLTESEGTPLMVFHYSKLCPRAIAIRRWLVSLFFCREFSAKALKLALKEYYE